MDEICSDKSALEIVKCSRLLFLLHRSTMLRFFIPGKVEK
jgi:hypothetical protein